MPIQTSKEKLKDKKYLKAKEEERIETLGQESETKGAKWVIEEGKTQEKEDEILKARAYEILTKLTRNKLKYNFFLTKLFYRFLLDEDIDKKYSIWARPTSKGIEVGIRDTLFTSALKTSGIAKYDFFGMKVLAIRVGNTIAHLEGYRPQTEAGLFIPDEIDRKKYGRLN